MGYSQAGSHSTLSQLIQVLLVNTPLFLKILQGNLRLKTGQIRITDPQTPDLEGNQNPVRLDSHLELTIGTEALIQKQMGFSTSLNI